ncbi:MAG TPA: FKBP-type peptidyl-prolyl cis-trans isomerase [Kofleriaceae bacterium]|nr:FKBP-type peptidyl-prolyl cis-trans isomerase [Kofleriaceae bacterium]
MKTWMVSCSLLVGAVSCNDDDAPPVDRRSRAGIAQVAPPIDLEAPPKDATSTASGLAYKKLVASERGAQPARGGTALIHYTGWSQRTGATFFTTRGNPQPIALEIAHASSAFAEVLPLLHKGETAMVWVPPSRGMVEAVVYQIEVVDVVAPAAARR